MGVGVGAGVGGVGVGVVVGVGVGVMPLLTAAATIAPQLGQRLLLLLEPLLRSIHSAAPPDAQAP